MEKLKIKIDKAKEFVINALMSFDYPENINIVDNINEEGQVSFTAYYDQVVNGQNTKSIMAIRMKNFKELMRIGMEQKGYHVEAINIINNKDTISFESFVEIATYGNMKRIKRRK